LAIRFTVTTAAMDLQRAPATRFARGGSVICSRIQNSILAYPYAARPELESVASARAPKQPELVGVAAKRQVDVMRSGELESSPTFQVKHRRGRLVGFGIRCSPNSIAFVAQFKRAQSCNKSGRSATPQPVSG
jgi:hypothetical protein